jgi:hypothetical protein
VKHPASMKKEIARWREAHARAQVFKSQIEYLVKAGRKMKRDPAQAAEDVYLQAVYHLFCLWEANGTARSNSWATARMAKIPRSPTTHPLRILIDATSAEPDPDLRRVWSRALRYAAYMDVEPHVLIDFFEANDGLEGCARKYSRPAELKYSKSKTREDTRNPTTTRAVLFLGSEYRV